MSQVEIQDLEKQIYELSIKLGQLRTNSPGEVVENYVFQSLTGEISLRDLFGKKDKLFLIHNMGQGCRYCTLWADGINSFIPHLEDQFSVAMVSKDDPETQRQMANSRGWRFPMASHGGGKYMAEQSVAEGNYPGMVCYEIKDNLIHKKNSTTFGPGDQFCSLWHILSLGGVSPENWTPQYNYWKRPQKMDDGGQNLV